MFNLTEKQAYLAMFAFLEAEYQITGSDEIGALLGSMSLLQDDSPVDPAVKKQWANAIAVTLEGRVNASLSFTK